MSGSKPENIIFLESPEGATKMYQMMDFIHKEVDHCGEWGGKNKSLGCDLVCFSGLKNDMCSVCGGNNDCKGQWWLWLAISVALIFAMLALWHYCHKRARVSSDMDTDGVDLERKLMDIGGDQRQAYLGPTLESTNNFIAL